VTKDTVSVSDEIAVAEQLLKHAQLLRKTPNPQKAIAAANWEIRLTAEIAELREREQQPELACVDR
jgi:hypothetical protein